MAGGNWSHPYQLDNPPLGVRCAACRYRPVSDDNRFDLGHPLNELCGHADNSAGVGYIHEGSVDAMKAAIEKLTFDGFALAC
jgi:hypothetical protein